MNPDQNWGGGTPPPQSTGGKKKFGGGRPPGPPPRTAYDRTDCKVRVTRRVGRSPPDGISRENSHLHSANIIRITLYAHCVLPLAHAHILLKD